jgi:uracil phosphoribosyltransferase
MVDFKLIDTSHGLTSKEITALDEIESKYQMVSSCEDPMKAKLLTTELSNMTKKLLYGKPIHVYGFETASENHSEASRIISKLRDVRTGHHEFVYYTQRAYEILFKLRYVVGNEVKRFMVVDTPVTEPSQQRAYHKVVDVDRKVQDTVMCVLLRGALLPSMILSKEIQEYSSNGYVTPFALFRISRDDTKTEEDMVYKFVPEQSYFKTEELNGKNLLFADPMNATGGSLMAIIDYLTKHGVKPKSVQFFNCISTVKGALRVVNTIPNASVWAVWMDPTMNTKAYVLPGCGDCGNRLNGEDEGRKRGMTQLLADYGSNICGLYREQLFEIERIMVEGRQSSSSSSSSSKSII